MKMRILYLILLLGIFLPLTAMAENYRTVVSDSKEYFYFIKTNGELYRFNVASDDITFEKVMDNVVSISGNYAIKDDGSMWSWDDTLSDIFIIAENVKDISSSESHTLILKNDNSLWGLGNNSCGQLAQGEIEYNEDSLYFKYKCVPYDFSEPVKIMEDVKCAEAGSFYSCVLKNDGSVWTFGCNHFGELGYISDREINNEPVRIFENAKNIYTGEASGFATDENNILYRWGTNYADSTAGKPADIEKIPVKYSENVKYVSDMNGINLIIKEDNTLWIYGGEDVLLKVADNVDSVSSMNEYGDKAVFTDKNGFLYLLDIKEYIENNTVQKIADNIQLINGITSSDDIKLIIGGELIKTDVNPIIINDRTMVPVRAIFEKIGAEVMYNADEKTVTAVKKDKIVELTIDSNIMKINGAETKIESPAVIINDRTFVPVRACAEAFNLEVEWIEDSRTVKIKREVLTKGDVRLSNNM